MLIFSSVRERGYNANICSSSSFWDIMSRVALLAIQVTSCVSVNAVCFK